MFGARASVALALACALLPSFPRPVAADALVPLDYKAYDGWSAYLISFDGEEHGLRGREQQKYWTVHLDEWFDHWLKGAPRPSWLDGVDFLHRGERNVRPLYGEPD